MLFLLSVINIIYVPEQLLQQKLTHDRNWSDSPRGHGRYKPAVSHRPLPLPVCHSFLTTTQDRKQLHTLSFKFGPSNLFSSEVKDLFVFPYSTTQCLLCNDQQGATLVFIIFYISLYNSKHFPQEFMSQSRVSSLLHVY